MSHKPIQGLSDLPGQLAIPGTDRNSYAHAPMRGDRPQKPCDIGLFSDEANQIDLIDVLKQQT